MTLRPLIAWALLGALAGTPVSANAEFRADFGNWSYDLSGQVTDNGQNYDFDRDLRLQTVGRASAQLQWYTGPRKPDVLVSYSRFGATGHEQHTAITGFPPTPQTVTVDTTGDFKDYDVTLRWPTGHGFAVGLAIQQFDGEIVIDDSSNPPPNHEHYSVTFPQLHVAWRAPLSEWLTLTGVGQGVALAGNNAIEWRIAAELTLFEHLLLEAGYQVKRYKIEIDDYRLDARLGGALLRAGFAWGN